MLTLLSLGPCELHDFVRGDYFRLPIADLQRFCWKSVLANVLGAARPHTRHMRCLMFMTYARVGPMKLGSPPHEVMQHMRLLRFIQLSKDTPNTVSLLR